MVKGTGGVKTGMTGHTKRIEYFKTSVKSYAWYATTSPISYIGEMIEEFWFDDTHRRPDTWKEHRDINMVMLATSLAPDTYLII
jgi:hypothetical protein